MKERTEFSYKIDEDFDFIIEEKANTFIALRKIAWGEGKESKLDLRKWYSSQNGETVGKGVSMSDEGANELVKVLLENNYGYTNEILAAIKDRDDFRIKLNAILGEDDPNYDKDVKDDEVYYDPMKALFEDEESA